MNGGGGGYGRSAPWQPEKLQQSMQQTRRKEQEAAVAQVIKEALARINQVDTEALNRHKETVLAVLNDQFEGAHDLRGGGSYTRGTFVNGLSDVDVLLDLGTDASSDVANKHDPQALLEEMERRLQQRLPRTTVSAGRMAVTVRYSDGLELQVLPAFRLTSGYRIPDPQGDGWATARPRTFARMLQEGSAKMGGGLRRCIKLAKYICGQQGIEIRSYHLENIAVKAFEHYAGPQTTAAKLEHLFNRAKSLVLTPMADVTGQDTHVDRYLPNQASRQTLASRLAAAERRIVAAGVDAEVWKKLLL